ncbi:putative ADP,ATP carrier protein [Glycine soja]|uniref:ADP/ATP translocase n=1 Tax=Glycine soja TaxID=3848 RepID=A0A445G935_GLYSO|nr:putative ADP,ATP carrier protein [Glycine soja]
MAGAVMGGEVHTIMAPIERAKLLLQTQESNLTIVASGRLRFKGMLDCIARTVREEGILSLWRGNGSSVIRYYPSVALNFSLKPLVALVYPIIQEIYSGNRLPDDVIDYQWPKTELNYDVSGKTQGHAVLCFPDKVNYEMQFVVIERYPE